MITLKEYKSLLKALGGKTVFEGLLKSMPQAEAPIEQLYLYAYAIELRRLVENEIKGEQLGIQPPSQAFTLRDWLAWDALSKLIDNDRIIDLTSMAYEAAWAKIKAYMKAFGRESEICGEEWEKAEERVSDLLYLLWGETPPFCP